MELALVGGVTIDVSAPVIVRRVAAVESLAASVGDRVDAWEIWNEPDLFPPYNDNAEPGGRDMDVAVPTVHYAELARQTAAVLRQHSPGAQLVLGGLQSARGQDYLLDVENAAGGGLLAQFNGVGVHRYESQWWKADATRALFPEYSTLHDGYGLAIWLTEIGSSVYYDGPPHTAGNDPSAFIRALYAAVHDLAAQGWRTGPVFYFSYKNGFPWERYGLVSPDDQPVPGGGYYTYAELATCAQGSALPDQEPQVPPSVQPEVADCSGIGAARYVNASPWLNLRARPETGAVVTELPCGSIVTLHGESEAHPGWFAVGDGGGSCG